MRFFGKILDNLPRSPFLLLKQETPKPIVIVSESRQTELNPQATPWYQREILDFLLHKPAAITDPDYMKNLQKDLNSKMRAILIDWLICVQGKFELTSRTLFLAISILDRFLEKVPIARQQLQLVGICCLLIASKVEEVHYPEINDFVVLSDFSYSKPEIIDMEGDIVGSLNFELNEALSVDFLELIANKLEVKEEVMEMGRFLLELSLLEYEILKFSRGILGFAASFLAIKAFQVKKLAAWGKFVKEIELKSEEIKECVKVLVFLVKNSHKSSLKQVALKYRRVWKNLSDRLEDFSD